MPHLRDAGGGAVMSGKMLAAVAIVVGVALIAAALYVLVASVL